MNGEGGFLFIFDEYRRSERLLNYVQSAGGFTDAISVEDWGYIGQSLCLLSFDGETLSHLAVVRGGGRASTFKMKVEFSHIMDIGCLEFGEVEHWIGPRFRHHFVRVSQGQGHRVPPQTWYDLMRVVKELRPELAERIHALEVFILGGHRHLVGPRYGTVALEKDAVATALGMFGDRRRDDILNWMPPSSGDAPGSFLEGLMAERPTEDDIIRHDAGVFGPLWRALRSDVRGLSVFGRGNQSLWVFNANRKGIEHTLGVDLLYFHHTYSSYTLVQYKPMEPETLDGEPTFRLTDRSAYANELARMKAFRDQHSDEGDGGCVASYRLSPSAFFFKLCLSNEFEPFSRSLLPGRYVPLDLWELYEQSDYILGPRDGKRLTRSTLRRYLCNTLFVNLVEDGWVGSRGEVTNAIDLLVGRVERDRDVVVAIGQPGNPFGTHNPLRDALIRGHYRQPAWDEDDEWI